MSEGLRVLDDLNGLLNATFPQSRACTRLSYDEPYADHIRRDFRLATSTTRYDITGALADGHLKLRHFGILLRFSFMVGALHIYRLRSPIMGGLLRCLSIL